MRKLQPRQRTGSLQWVAAFTLAIAAGSVTAPVARAPEPRHDLPAFTDTPLQQYRALRRMHAISERFNHEGWMDAWTEFDSGGFRYQIVAERGSDTVRNKVLRTVLKREQEAIASGNLGRGELTAANYEFGEEVTGPGERYIPIKPKRKDVMLIDGRIVLGADGDLLRVEGRISKNPSFWTSEVQIKQHFARVNGVRVPILMESVAKVKLVGRSNLNVRYEYETINGEAVKTAAASAPAALLPASAR